VRHRTRVAIAAVLLGLFAAGLTMCIRRDTGPEPAAQVPAILHFDDGGLRFTYHVPTGSEGLFDVAADPKMLRNLAPERPDDTARLREELRRKLGVESLSDLRRARQDLIDRLHALGYF
jgi:hypothetical protein